MTVVFEVDPPLTPELREQIIDLWLASSNAGGAIGFAGVVTRDEISAAAGPAFDGVLEGHDRICVAIERPDRPDQPSRAVALLFSCGKRFDLARHWRTLRRVMVHPDLQGQGFGRELLRQADQMARADGVEAIQLTCRDGLGLDVFYRSCGYELVGRHPGALRLGPGDDRDELIFWRQLTPSNR